MTTIINASNGSTSGLITTADASGVLQLQTNNGTPALTLNTTQALGVGSSPSYGTTGQFLTSQGSAASPTWTTPSSGAMTLISTQTASNSTSLQWTGLSGYNSYVLIFNNIQISSVNSKICMQVGTGSGPTYLTSGYSQSILYQSQGSASAIQGTGYTYLTLTPVGISVSGSFSGDIAGINGNITLNGFLTQYLSIEGVSQYVSYTSLSQINASGGGVQYSTSAPYTAFKMYPNAGNITSGTASLYGISS
jgi:hypothetical protein